MAIIQTFWQFIDLDKSIYHANNSSKSLQSNISFKWLHTEKLSKLIITNTNHLYYIFPRFWAHLSDDQMCGVITSFPLECTLLY